MQQRSLLVFVLLCSCSPPPTSVLIKITDGHGSVSAAPLVLSVFDAHHALATRLPLGDKALPLAAVAYNLPAKAEPVRLVIARAAQPPELGAASVTLVARAQVTVAVTLAASTPDSDGDGIPDSVDNCRDVANPDQASSTGTYGDACRPTAPRDLSLPLVDDLAPPPIAPADLAGVVALYAFQYTLPAHQSLYYGGHDKPPATITFSSSADSATCSHDGLRFSSCDSPTTIVFTPDDYNNGVTLQIKLEKAGLPPYVATLNPKQLMPGLQFFNCDQLIASDEATAMFTKRLALNRVLCLGPSVSITDSAMHNDDGGVHVGLSGIFLQAGNATGVKILGTESNPGRFYNPDGGGNQGILISFDNTVHDMVVANLNLVSNDGNPISFETNGGHNAFSNLVVSTGGGGDNAVIFNDGDNTLYNVIIRVDGSYSTPGLSVGGTAKVTFTNGHIFGRDETNAIQVNGGVLTLVNVAVDNAAQTSTTPKIAAVLINGGALTASGGSSVRGPANDAIDVLGSGRLTLSDSTVFGSAIAISSDGASTVNLSSVTLTTDGIGIKTNGSMLTLDNTLIERLDQAGSAAAAVAVFGTNTIFSTKNGNHFCDQNKSGANLFSGGVVTDSGSSGMYSGSFMLNKQVNMGVVDQCP